MKKWLWSLLVTVLLLVMLAGFAARELTQRWQAPLNIAGEPLIFQVAAGDSLTDVARQLDSQGVFSDPWLMIAYGRATGLDAQLKRGEYRIPSGTTPEGFLQIVTAGQVVQYQVTIPEGLTLAKALGLLQGEAELSHVIEGVDDPRLLALTSAYPSPEGLFLPESYYVVRGDSDWDLLQRAFADMQRVLKQEWAERDEGLPLESPYEALILASIIERETGVPEERAEIAGVFVRRLQQGMRLQTDPTIIYGLGEAFDGNLRRSDLRDESNPYNTYRHDGLPPTPIALPGRAAIHAALHPAAGKALFFVARGDGSHEFSDTLAAHERAVRKYQLRRRADYRSSPE